MPSNQVKFKVYAPNYGKIATTNPSGLSYDIRYFVPIYDPNFQEPTEGGVFDVAQATFLSEDGISHSEWWDQYETINAGEIFTIDGQKIWLRGSFDPISGRYTHSSGYVLDAQNVNVSTGLFNQTKEVSAITIGDCWKVKPYKPVNVTASSGSVGAGSYDCVVPGNAGNFSWNKMALFLAELDTNGVETGNLFFFGMVYSNVRLVKNRLLNGSGQSISPNFTIRFNVIISGETYDPSRYEYLFFTESFWYFINSDTISTTQKTLLGFYDNAFSNAIDSPLNAWTNILDPDATAFSIGGIITGTVPFAGTVKTLHEYRFKVDRLAEMIRSETVNLRVIPYSGGIISHTVGGLTFGAKVLWAGENGLAMDYNTNALGKGIESVGFGSWSVGKDIYNNGNFNFNFGDGELTSDPTGLNFGSQTNGNFNFNFGLRNRIGAFWGTGAQYPRFGYGILQFGSDNYAQGYNSINFGDCNYSNQRATYLFGYKNVNKMFAFGEVTSAIGGLSSPMNSFEETHHRNMNVWILGANNSIASRGNNSGSSGDGADFTDVFIIGSHINTYGAPITRHILLGKNLVMGFGGNVQDRGAGLFLGGDAYLGTAPKSHVSVIEGSGLGTAIGSMTTLLDESYADQTIGSFYGATQSALSRAVHSVMTRYGHNMRPYVLGNLVREQNYIGNPGDAYVVDGTIPAQLDQIYTSGVSGDVTSVSFRQLDPTFVKNDVMRTAWVYFHKLSLIIEALRGGSTPVDIDAGRGSVVGLQSSSSNIPVQMVNNPTYQNHIIIDSFQSTVVAGIVSGFDPLTRMVNGKRLYLYITRLKSWINPNDTEDVGLYNAQRGSLSFFGDAYQVKEIVSIGSGKYAFRIAKTDATGDVMIPNNYDDGGFNFYQKGCGFVLIENDRYDYLQAQSPRGQKGFILTGLTNHNHDISFVSTTPNDYLFTVGAINSSDFINSSYSVLVGERFIGGSLDSSMSIGHDTVTQNTYGSSFFGTTLRHTYLDTFRMATPSKKFMHSDVNSQPAHYRFNFQKAHSYILGTKRVDNTGFGGYESVFDSWHGTELHANLNLFASVSDSYTGGISGHTAFTRLFGSHLYIGRDFIDGSIGTSGVMYADLFGYDINILIRTSSGVYRPQYNIHGHGMHLLLTRNDQFVFGQLNEGRTNNLFEFGAGRGNYQRETESNGLVDNGTNDGFTERRNGFAYGFLNDFNTVTQSDASGLHPAFKVGTGILHFEDEWDNWNGGRYRGGNYEADITALLKRTPTNRSMMTRNVKTSSAEEVVEGQLLRYSFPSSGSSLGTTFIPIDVDPISKMGLSELYVTPIPMTYNTTTLLNEIDIADLYITIRQLIGVCMVGTKTTEVASPLVMAWKGGPFTIHVRNVPNDIAADDWGWPVSWRCLYRTIENEDGATASTHKKVSLSFMLS